MRLKAEMMANYKANVTSVSRIVEADGVPFLQRKDGIVVGLFPLDYVASTRSFWQKEKAVSEALSRLQGVGGKELWIEGMFDPVTRKALEAKGWKVEDSVGEKLIKK